MQGRCVMSSQHTYEAMVYSDGVILDVRLLVGSVMYLRKPNTPLSGLAACKDCMQGQDSIQTTRAALCLRIGLHGAMSLSSGLSHRFPGSAAQARQCAHLELVHLNLPPWQRVQHARHH